MNATYINRNAFDLAEEILSDTPVLSVMGARQVGKSTLVRALVENRKARFLNLDDRAVMESAKADPDGFARQFPEGTLAIDEIQRAPELLQAIKGALEQDRNPGRFIITGSSNVLDLRGGQESLAGRAESIRLRGFSQGERRGHVDDFIFSLWINSPGNIKAEPLERRQYLELVIQPDFPEIADAHSRRINRWVDGYVERILSKDVSELYGIQHLDRLRTLLELLAAQGTSEFVAAKIGRALDIPERTIPSYLNALRNVFLVDTLPAWGTNFGKRVISKPKVHVQDTGLAASLSGVTAESLEMDISSTITGGLVEAFVTSELLKQQAWSEIDFRLFHFRESTGKEVDIVVETRMRDIIGIEVKAAVSVSAKDVAGLKRLREIAGTKFHTGLLFYTGKEVLPMGEQLWAVPISALWSNPQN